MSPIRRDTRPPEHHPATTPLLAFIGPPLRDRLTGTHNATEELAQLHAERKRALKDAAKLGRRARGWGPFRFLSRAARERAKEDSHITEAHLLDLDLQIEERTRAALLDPSIADDPAFVRLCAAFAELGRCGAAWRVVLEREGPTYQGHVPGTVRRKRIQIGTSRLPAVSPDIDAPCFQNAGGPSLYFYPTFVVRAAPDGPLVILQYGAFTVTASVAQVREMEGLPPDADVIGHGWAHENKDGTRDHRFGDNPEVPVVRYGLLRVTSTTGLEEEFMFSNAQYLLDFAKAIPPAPASY